MAGEKTLHFSTGFAISCGTVTIDLARKVVLAIRHRPTGEIYLAKGRKDIGETLEQAAVRETFEETGCHVSLLPLEIPTLATIPSQTTNHLLETASNPGKTRNGTTEPFAVTQRVTDGVLKIIFWFAAKVDSGIPPQTGTQQEGEDFEPLWLNFEDYERYLTFGDDREMVKYVINAASKLFRP